jgi:transposase
MSTLLPEIPCPGCLARDRHIAGLQQQMQRMQQQLDALQETVARLQKNSSNSSKPPSSDIVKPPKSTPKKGKKRRQGGQPGHTKYERIFHLAEADVLHEYPLDRCPACADQALVPIADSGPVHYQYELVERPIILHAHQAHAYWCATCDAMQRASLPSVLRQEGLVGPRLTGLVGYLKGSGHLSYATMQTLLDEGLGATLSTGMLAKVVDKVSQALAPIYQPLLDALPDQEQINIDETGHKDQGRLLWTWSFATPSFTAFHIAPSRGSQVLEHILGNECAAVLGHDYFSAYRAFMKKTPVTVQFCLAHLIREVRFLTESTNRAIAQYGQRLLDQLKALFQLIHRRNQLPPETFQRRLEQAREHCLKTGRRTKAGGAAALMAKRFRTHGRDYFTFITCPHIEPTNNVSERALRFCVIDRRITQGTRGRKGQQWCERFWTIRQTCRQQGTGVCHFIQQAVQAYFQRKTPPSLLPI